MPKKQPPQLLVGTLVDVQVNGALTGRGSTKSTVSVQVLINGPTGPEYAWFAVIGNPLRARIRQLMPASDFVMNHQFEFSVNESGQVVAVRRVEP